MSNSQTDLKSILVANGYSVTRQRLLIFNYLLNKEPMTMFQLAELVNQQIDRASIYRIVALFEQIDIIHRINIGWKYKIELSDRFMTHHHHLTCLKCSAVVQIKASELEHLINRLASKHKFDIIEHQIELQGYCQDCRVLTSN